MAFDQLTIKNGLGANVTAPVHTDEDGNVIPIQSRDGTLRTFSYGAAMAAADIAATPTDIVTLTGSATAGVVARVKSIIVRGYWDTGATALAIPIVIKKHTVANTGGTATAPTPTVYDSTDAAAACALAQYSANPTVDATATTIAYMHLAATLETVGVGVVEFNFMNNAEHGLVLRGVAQQVAINLAAWAGTQTGVNLSYTIVWSEETE